MAQEAAKKETTRKPNLKYMHDKDREPVKGVFHFYEVPGGSMSFVYKKYKEDDVERYDLIDGLQYTLPLGVAKHLNKEGRYPVYEHVPTESGNIQMTGVGDGRNPMQGMRIGRKVARFGFQSLEFLDIDGLEEEPALFTAEKVVV